MNRYKSIFLLLILLVGVAALSSCGSSKQVVYFPGLEARGNRNQTAGSKSHYHPTRGQDFYHREQP